MQEKESFDRGEALGSELRQLPAETYNTLRLLLDYSEANCVFVPIRSMQYMAVIDQEEIIFVDAVSARRSIELIWHKFKPQERSNLTTPVSYRLTYYDKKALETMKRLQWEFNKFVQQQYNRLKKNQLSSDTKIITLDIKKTDS